MNVVKSKIANIGMRTLTDAQYAVMYLMHKNKVSELIQPYRSMDAKNLRICAGLSDQTIRHQLRRYAIILDGQENLILVGDEYYEALLQKLQDQEDFDPNELRRDLRLAHRFIEIGLKATALMANEAFTDENKEIGEYYYNKNLEQQSKYAQDKRQKDNGEKKNIVQFVSDYTKSFSKVTSFADAQTKAIKLAAIKFSKKESEIKKILQK